MCGIAAILLHPQERSSAVWQEIAEIFTRNLLFNEARGQEATGAAIVQADGTLRVFKAPVPASEFIHLPEYHAILQMLTPRTTLLCGHTRQPTKGTPNCTANNHPLQAGTVLGVHNGHIENDDALFAHYGYPRAGQVDSEIIFRMLEPTSAETCNGNYLNTAAQSIRLLQGKFTFLACDQRAAHKLLVLKHNNPLCLHFHARLNALIFSSRYIFLRKAFGHAVVTEALPHDRLLLFDATRLPELGSIPAEELPLFAEQAAAV